MLSRIIWGSRTAIEVVVVAVVLSLLIGVPLGLISGYVGGRLDRVLVLIMDALFAFPYILLAIVIAFLLSDSIGQGIFSAAIAITVVYIPQYFRVVRNHVISVREENYVEAARALGAPRRTIITPLRVLQRDPERARDRDPERRRRDRHPRGARASSATGSSRPRRPSGATTCSGRSTTPAPGSGGPGSSRASRSCS